MAYGGAEEGWEDDSRHGSPSSVASGVRHLSQRGCGESDRFNARYDAAILADHMILAAANLVLVLLGPAFNVRRRGVPAYPDRPTGGLHALVRRMRPVRSPPAAEELVRYEHW